MQAARPAQRGVLDVAVALPLDGFRLDVTFHTGGGVTGIFGPSGAGKTSLLEAVAGVRRGVAGRITLGGESWLDSGAHVDLPPEARGVGYVPQDGLLFPHLSVRANLRAGMGRAARRGSHADDAEAVFESAVDLLELRGLLDRPAPTLSGGERRRVALGRALCSGPDLLLLDEPLAGLDHGLRGRLLPFLRRIDREFRLPSLLVSHDPVELVALCDELVVVQRGEKIAQGAPREVLTDPAVYPLAGHESFQNLLDCELVESRGGTSRLRLRGAGPEREVVTVALEGAPGARVLLGLPAHEIIIATEPPTGLSARNAWDARIEHVQTAGNIELVTAALTGDHPELTIEITDTTIRALGLEPGKEVYLIFKATSCRLIGSAPAAAP